MKQELLFLSGNDIRQALSMREAIEAMRSAFIQLSGGEAQVALRTRLELNDKDDCALFMPVYLPREEKVAVKTVTFLPNNPQKGLPAIHALVSVFDAANGQPLAVLDGEVLTALRTGAASGLATDLLAAEEAAVLALFGAGVQARTQFQAIRTVRPINKVLIVDTDEQKAQLLAEEIQSRFPHVAAESVSAEAAAAQAEIICTVTTSRQPVFQDSWLKQGVHINGVGSFRPDMQEIPAETVQRAALFVDSREACLQEPGDIIIPLQQGLIDKSHIRAEIGEVAAGTAAGRKNPDEITFFKSVGNGVQDLAAAAAAIRNAGKLKLGQKVTI